MKSGPSGEVRRQLRTLFDAGTVAGLSDDELLERFADNPGAAAEDAFAALMARHGPMVLRVCRGVLRDSNAAEDAYQATFVVLARRAGEIRNRQGIGPWLHGVALRVSACARTTDARRRARERRGAKTDVEYHDDPEGFEIAPIVHEELGRLPEKYRQAAVLCYLEGLSHEQAARQLGWPVGSVKSRLSWARERLRSRLVRRGLAPSAVALIGETSVNPASAAVPPTLAAATMTAALRGAASPAVMSLAKGTARTLALTRVRWTAALIAAALTLGAGASALMFRPIPRVVRPTIKRPPFPNRILTGARLANTDMSSTAQANLDAAPGYFWAVNPTPVYREHFGNTIFNGLGVSGDTVLGVQGSVVITLTQPLPPEDPSTHDRLVVFDEKGKRYLPEREFGGSAGGAVAMERYRVGPERLLGAGIIVGVERRIPKPLRATQDGEEHAQAKPSAWPLVSASTETAGNLDADPGFVWALGPVAVPQGEWRYRAEGEQGPVLCDAVRLKDGSLRVSLAFRPTSPLPMAPNFHLVAFDAARTRLLPNVRGMVDVVDNVNNGIQRRHYLLEQSERGDHVVAFIGVERPTTEAMRKAEQKAIEQARSIDGFEADPGYFWAFKPSMIGGKTREFPNTPFPGDGQPEYSHGVLFCGVRTENGSLQIDVVHPAPTQGHQDFDCGPVVFDPQRRRIPSVREYAVASRDASGAGVILNRYRVHATDLQADGQVYLGVERAIERTKGEPPESYRTQEPTMGRGNGFEPPRGWTWTVEPTPTERESRSPIDPNAGDGAVVDAIKTANGDLAIALAYPGMVPHARMAPDYSLVILDAKGHRLPFLHGQLWKIRDERGGFVSLQHAIVKAADLPAEGSFAIGVERRTPEAREEAKRKALEAEVLQNIRHHKSLPPLVRPSPEQRAIVELTTRAPTFLDKAKAKMTRQTRDKRGSASRPK